MLITNDEWVYGAHLNVIEKNGTLHSAGCDVVLIWDFFSKWWLDFIKAKQHNSKTDSNLFSWLSASVQIPPLMSPSNTPPWWFLFHEATILDLLERKPRENGIPRYFQGLMGHDELGIEFLCRVKWIWPNTHLVGELGGYSVSIFLPVSHQLNNFMPPNSPTIQTHT